MKADYPRIAAEYGGDDEFAGTGGLKQLEASNPSLQRDALDALAMALGAFRSIDCPEQRSAIIENAERTLKEMKEHGSWHAQPF